MGITIRGIVIFDLLFWILVCTVRIPTCSLSYSTSLKEVILAFPFGTMSTFGHDPDVPAFFIIKGLIVTDGNKSSVAGVLVNQFGLSIGTVLNYLFKGNPWSLVCDEGLDNYDSLSVLIHFARFGWYPENTTLLRLSEVACSFSSSSPLVWTQDQSNSGLTLLNERNT